MLYENLKRGEDTLQDLSVFVKERISLEEETLRFLTKNLNRVSLSTVRVSLCAGERLCGGERRVRGVLADD